MSFAVGVLTHNAIRYGRLPFLKKTIRSLVAAMDGHDAELFIVSNGSGDGTEDIVREMGGVVVADPVTSCGHGMNVTMGICASAGKDYVLFSNDDLEWRSDSLTRLSAWWAAAPRDIVIMGGILEDDFPWNTPIERVEHGGQVALVRKTAPGAAWSFRSQDWPRIHPIPEAPGWDDVPTCERLRSRGYRVAQMDLAAHLGQEHSTWGNDSQRFGKPLDRRYWRIP